MVEAKAIVMLFVVFTLFSTFMAVCAWNSAHDIDSSVGKTYYYVATNCFEDDYACRTLKYYMQNQSLLFKSDTTFVFQRGYHIPDVS